MEADGPTAIDAVAAHDVVRLRDAAQRGSAEDVEWLLADGCDVWAMDSVRSLGGSSADGVKL
jgi:hypothetical protein